MMLDYKVKIGLVPERRYLPGPKRTGIFNPDYAVANKNKAIEYIKLNFSDENTEFVDIEFLNEEGLLCLVDDCEKVADYFKQQKVDAIFIINCNFGNEEVVGEIARLMNVPVLLWWPRDTIFEGDGTRYTDTQCGLFAAGKQLKRYGTAFTCIENCHVEDKAFTQGLEKFLSVVCMYKNFKKLDVVQVGARVKPFKSIMYNEMELTEKFGIMVTPINMAEASEKLNRIYSEKFKQLKTEAEDFKKKFDTSSVSDDTLVKNDGFCPLL